MNMTYIRGRKHDAAAIFYFFISVIAANGMNKWW